MRFWVLVLAVAACNGKEPAGECTAITEGPWDADGSCIGMLMHATVTVEADGCSFSFSDWDMAMTNLPSDGTVAGDEVTLTFPDKTDCIGTTDGTSITGVCSDGCDFVLNYEG